MKYYTVDLDKPDYPNVECSAEERYDFSHVVTCSILQYQTKINEGAYVQTRYVGKEHRVFETAVVGLPDCDGYICWVGSKDWISARRRHDMLVKEFGASKKVNAE